MATKDYSTDLQKLFLEIMLSDAQCFVRVQNIFNSINFDRSLRSAADFVAEYSKKYNNLPTTAQVKAETGTALDKVDGLDDTMTDWFLDEFESFTRHET